jgi:hypothetical protein
MVEVSQSVESRTPTTYVALSFKQKRLIDDQGTSIVKKIIEHLEVERKKIISIFDSFIAGGLLSFPYDSERDDSNPLISRGERESLKQASAKAELLTGTISYLKEKYLTEK